MSQSGKSRSIKSASSRVRSAIDRAGMIQQREQLRQTMVHKFHQDYAKGNVRAQEIITDIVNDYFQNEKINEMTLKALKQRVVEACGKAPSRRPPTSQAAKSEISKHVTVREDDVSDRQSVAQSVGSQKSQKSKKSQAYDDRSVTSSQQKGPRSVYIPDEEDEWTALVKFDTEMFKKEQELEAQRQREFKRKMKEELDRQLEEKRKRKIEEQAEETAYVRLNEHQMAVYDQRENDKKKQLILKQRQEKAQRDKQVHDEERRKALERRKERELDNILVKRIHEELTQEQREMADRKEKEKERLKEMISENEYNKQRLELETQKEKRQEVDMQEKYTRLLDQMERQREQDRLDREEKIKRIMSSFAQTVVQDQKNMLKDEDDKMLKALVTQNEAEQSEENRKKHQIRQQKLEMRKFLSSQMDEKRRRKEEEQQLDQRQAQVWRNDLENYEEHEYQKTHYIKSVNLRHQDILKQQMDERQSKSRGKQARMTTTELMHNKPLFKEMADKGQQVKVKKVTIGEDL